MWRIFCRSLGLHLTWFVQSLIPGRHKGAPLGLRRLVFLLLLFPLLVAVQLVHWCCFLLDEVFFPGYRRTPVKSPVFVTGIPRSGTTFVHRTLAAHPEFTSFSTWEAVLAPTILQRKIIRGLAACDRRIGSPARKLVDVMILACSGDFNAIHEVALDAPEEDYLALLPAGSCFILLLAFPFSPWLKQTGMLDTMPPEPRAALCRFYKRLLQKHLYCAGPEKRLLSKNAAFGSWCGSLLACFPDAKFLLSVREPRSALSSQLSSLESARRLFATDPDGSQTAALFTEIFSHNYKALAEFFQTHPEHAGIVEQAELRRAPGECLEAALRQVEVPVEGSLLTALRTLTPGAPSQHRHTPDDYPLDVEAIEVCIKPSYDLILKARDRSISAKSS
ncbi:sulfotransferase [Coraliomargarita parva]|uniref:sulfotransferase n=1 Tax=Coraliomargarita parva TaxID=3014050 RepID=UPI0022B38AFA|nr:sulfotransferase [Coraliomargarita parva]